MLPTQEDARTSAYRVYHPAADNGPVNECLSRMNGDAWLRQRFPRGNGQAVWLVSVVTELPSFCVVERPGEDSARPRAGQVLCE